jgi:hypothetical protein
LNIQQLRILLGRCKSSINGAIQNLGYTAEPQSQAVDPELVQKFPPLCRAISELRKWTIRRSADTRVKYERPFTIPMPTQVINVRMSPQPVRQVDAEAIRECVHRKFPCPVKCRYKYYDLMYQTEGIQTEV